MNHGLPVRGSRQRRRSLLPIGGRWCRSLQQSVASLIDGRPLLGQRVDLEFVGPFLLVGVHRGARLAQREHRVDAVLQNLDAPGSAPNLGGDHALGDDGLQLLYARGNRIICQSIGSDPDHMARFQREAEVLASLDHPNIGTCIKSNIPQTWRH
jgi:hypothetical protein